MKRFGPATQISKQILLILTWPNSHFAATTPLASYKPAPLTATGTSENEEENEEENNSEENPHLGALSCCRPLPPSPTESSLFCYRLS